MSVCTFFGHRNAPNSIEQILRSTIEQLIENNNVNVFYVGNQGCFDSMVRRNLKALKKKYQNITYAVVLAYMPGESNELYYDDYSDTVFPENLEYTPPKYAIAKRNQWMVDNSDYVITYVKHSIGGAAKYKELAQRKNKTVIELAEL